MEKRNNKFYLNGEEFRIKGGSFHYFRCLPEYWDEIMKKIRGAGLNTVETYTAWNMHEPEERHFRFFRDAGSCPIHPSCRGKFS